MDYYAVIARENNMARNARRQVDKPVVREREPQSAATHNIWSGRRLMKGAPQEREHRGSQHRCHPSIDTGKTRGSMAGVTTFCLYFARGLCAEGSLCTYLHRLPTGEDEAVYASNRAQDIFGRQKVSDALDNRKEAGSYERCSHTIYVHYGGAGTIPVPELRQLLEANFGEWGPLDHVYIVPSKTIAFVRFHWRVTAEFAKEAMNGQTLTGSNMTEALKCRWANDDPNPVSVALKKREAVEALHEAVAAEFEALPPEAKQARLAATALDHAVRVTAVASDYPDTDAQFASSNAAGGASSTVTSTAAAAGGAYPDTDGQYGGASTSGHNGAENYPNTDAQYTGQGEASGQQQLHGYYDASGQWVAAAATGWYDESGQWYWYTPEQVQQVQQLQQQQQQQAQATTAQPHGQPPDDKVDDHGAAGVKDAAPDPLGMLAGYGSSDDESDRQKDEQTGEEAGT